MTIQIEEYDRNILHNSATSENLNEQDDKFYSFNNDDINRSNDFIEDDNLKYQYQTNESTNGKLHLYVHSNSFSNYYYTSTEHLERHVESSNIKPY